MWPPGVGKGATARRGRFLAHQSCRCPCGARLVNPPGGCYMTAPPKVPVSVPTEAHSAHRGTLSVPGPPAPDGRVVLFVWRGMPSKCLSEDARWRPFHDRGYHTRAPPPPRGPMGGIQPPMACTGGHLPPPARRPPRGLGRAMCRCYMEFHIQNGRGRKSRLPPKTQKTQFGGKAAENPNFAYKIHSNPPLQGSGGLVRSDDRGQKVSASPSRG